MKSPDGSIFPYAFGAGDLRPDFKKEIELFIDSIIREDSSVLSLLDADYSYLNERLALHYGIRNINGNRFRRVDIEDPRRWGLLGKGGVSLTSAYPNRTSPVLRGAWILENIMGTPPPVPPPDVEDLPENEAGQPAVTVRERLEQHRQIPRVMHAMPCSILSDLPLRISMPSVTGVKLTASLEARLIQPAFCPVAERLRDP